MRENTESQRQLPAIEIAQLEMLLQCRCVLIIPASSNHVVIFDSWRTYYFIQTYQSHIYAPIDTATVKQVMGVTDTYDTRAVGLSAKLREMKGRDKQKRNRKRMTM